MKYFIKYITKILTVMFLTSILLSGCGIFKKGCDCPKFSKATNDSHLQVGRSI